MSNAQTFFSQPFPSIELKQVNLRELKLDDAERYYEIYTNPGITIRLSDEDLPTTNRDALMSVMYWRNCFRNALSIFWGIAEKDTNRLIGTIGFFRYDKYNRKAEICYDLDPAYWRRGIMTECLNFVLNLGYTEMDLYRISAKTMSDNEPSKEILKKFGFKEEGVIRGYRYIRGEFPDITIFSLLPNEFLKL